MTYLKIQKAVSWGCLATFVFGGVVVVFGFLLGFEVNKNFVGLAVVFGWLAMVVASLIFIFNSFIWCIDRAPWYWKSLSPLNFSFVLLVISLFRYNKDMGFIIPMIIVACSFVVALLVKAYRAYEKKIFLLVVVPCFFSAFGYYVPLLVGSLLLFVSIFSKQDRKSVLT